MDSSLDWVGFGAWFCGVEAVASKLTADALDKPVAHGPVDYAIEGFSEVVDPKKAVEVITENFIHCVPKGLHRARRIAKFLNHGMTASSVDAMIRPTGCFGRPHKACLAQGIPIIVVRANKSVLHDFEDSEKRFVFVDNYMEAAGMLMAMKAGVHPPAVRRPLEHTKVISCKHCTVEEKAPVRQTYP